MENKNNEQEKENEVNIPVLKYGFVSSDEYLEMDKIAPGRLEYVNGRILGKHGVNQQHLEISSTLFGEIYHHLRDKPCRLYVPGMRVVNVTREIYTYPDLIIFGGDPIVENFERNSMLNPGVVIEIFSNSVEQLDLDQKFIFYQKISCLREYIQIHSCEKYAKVHRQQPDKQWKTKVITGEDAVLTIEEIDFTISLNRIYERKLVLDYLRTFKS
jgi:Uma2 family endonuclease